MITRRLTWLLPLSIFAFCALIALSGLQRPLLPTALAGDLLLTAPVLASLLAHPGARLRVALRVFLLGATLAGLLLPADAVPFLALLRRFVAPAAEAILVGYLLLQLRAARRKAAPVTDPLDRCRALLLELTGSARAAALLATELTLPLYLFRRAPAGFSTGRRSGAVLVLGCFVGLFLVETVALHFLLALWKPLLAWVLTAAGLYSCLQLTAHLRALRVRPTIVTGTELRLRNGLLGGEADILRSNIARVQTGKRLELPAEALSLGLVPRLEAANMILYLAEPATIRRSFGRSAESSVIAFAIDDPEALAAALGTGPLS
ncbi:hypothetical protein [Flaviaesturariibacter terrae]